MANSCAIIPQVKNNDGKIVDSKLYKDLLSFTQNNRKEANRMYLITKNSEFIDKWNPKLTLDSNGEPTLSSLLKKTNFSDIIPVSKVLDRLNKEIGHYKKGTKEVSLVPDTDSNFQDLVDKAISFNNTSEFSDDYVATITKTNEDGNTKLGIQVEKRTKENTQEAKKMEYNNVLNNKLRDILASKGVSIGALTELERRLGVNGVTDFDKARTAREGLVEMIRLAEGIEGEKALPEEFAHAAIEMMSEHPLITRLLNNIATNELAAEILGDEYSTYNSLYEGNEAKLAKEAAGKLLAKHLLNNESIPSAPYKNLLQRVIQAVKDFFKRLGASDIQRAMLDADKSFGSLAKDIISGNMDEAMSISNIHSSELYYSTTDRVKRDKALLNKIINNETKRYNIYQKRNPSSSFNTKLQLFLNELEEKLITNNEIEGIYNFLEDALGVMGKLSERLEKVRTDSTSINEKARVLRDIRNYIYSYKGISKDVREALLDEEKYADNRYGDRVREALDNLTILLQDFSDHYEKTAMPAFVEFIKPFVGTDIAVPFAKYKGRVLTAENIEQLLKEEEDKPFFERDISFFDLWLDSMADSSEQMLKIIDKAVKSSRGKARLDTISVMKDLQAAGIKLEQAGIKDTEWMFEKDSAGNKTGKYISGKALDSLNAAQREFYNTVIKVKEELDSYLPPDYTSLLSAVKIRKDLVERVKDSDGVKSGAKAIWESIKDDWIRRGDDTMFGTKAALRDFEGRQVQMLPIYYTKMREGESLNDLSTDIVSTMTAYASMAIDFREMNKIIDCLELGRDILREKSVQQTQGNNPLAEKMNVLGRSVENLLTKQGDETRVMTRLNKYFEMQVYGRYMADEGTFGDSKIDKAKVANNINRMASMGTLALNFLSSISNVATGDAMMKTEAWGGRFFNMSNLLHADRIYRNNLFEYLAELGNRVKTSKLALWMEKFNVMQDYEQSVREVNFDRKNWFSRMFGLGTFFFLNNAGEHWMQTRTSLALADAYKMKSPTGQIVSLWDAMEVVYKDPRNKKLGAELQLKKGYTKADGTEFSLDETIAFERKSGGINNELHGIYNHADRNAIQNLALGRMAIMYRKYMRPAFNRRFAEAQKNYDLDAWTEGYYRTTYKFLKQIYSDLKEGRFNWEATKNNLSKEQIANLRMSIAEVGRFLAICAVLGMIDWDDDDYKDSYFMKMLEYQLRRLKTELGAVTPTPAMINEGLRLVQSPAVGVNVVQDFTNALGIFNPFNYESILGIETGGEDAVMKSGLFKGHNRATKLAIEAAPAPIKTMYRNINPESGIQFFKD